MIDKGTDYDNLKVAWTMLFTLSSDTEDKVQKKKIIEICKEITSKMVEDIFFNRTILARIQTCFQFLCAM